MGNVIISISDNEIGIIFVIVAKAPLKIEDTYLLKKSAKGVYAMAIMYIIKESIAMTKNTIDIFGNFSFWGSTFGSIFSLRLFSSIVIKLLSKNFIDDVIHIIGQGSIYERMVLWIDRNYLSSLCTENTDLSACFDGQTNLLRPGKVRGAQLQGLLESLAREYYDEQLGSAICAQGLLMQFLVELNRLARKNMGKVLAEPDLVSQVIAYIGNHYQENLTLESLAGQFYVSKFYLSHEFRERVGVSIHRYIIFRRLLQARDLMTAGVNPGQVYQICGFGDYANFYRAFKAEYGISPREFVQGK